MREKYYLKGNRCVEIRYATSKVKKLCTSVKEANKKIGKQPTIALQAALRFIENSESLQDVANRTSFHLHALKNKGKHKNRLGQYAIYLKGTGYRLCFELVDNQDQEDIVYREIRVIEIMEVTNHYGD